MSGLLAGLLDLGIRKATGYITRWSERVGEKV